MYLAYFIHEQTGEIARAGSPKEARKYEALGFTHINEEEYERLVKVSWFAWNSALLVVKP
jgi:hypothetical protein